MDNSLPYKQCFKCKEVKPFSDFYSTKSNSSGLTSYCKKCFSEYDSVRKKEKRAKLKALKQEFSTVPDGMKQCAKCKEIYPATREYFYVNHGKDGKLVARCKDCFNLNRVIGFTNQERLDIPKGMKRCTKCRNVYPANTEYFHYRKPRGKRGTSLNSQCKDCHRPQRVKSGKGIPNSEKLFTPEGTRQCATCKQVKDSSLFDNRRTNKFHVDCSDCRNIQIIEKGTVAKLKEIKICPMCKQEKTRSAFNTNKARTDGLASYCKVCQKQYLRQKPIPPPETIARFLESELPTRECYTCRQTKSKDEFNLRKQGDPTRGRMSECKDCQIVRGRLNYHRSPEYKKQHIILHAHKITEEQYLNMLMSQGGVCAICGNGESAVDDRTGVPKKLSIDHCHKTGKIRGLLCGRCNSMLGMARDDVKILMNAKKYLLKDR